ncbi:hypothetical protein DVS77_23310 [Mycolicibacterium moriokaense]|nr:hypothetical protein DVS77_23310 [Mycolicibacterium moriokaense]
MGDNGGTSDLPWASVFDPAANARALSAIQAEGFRAASKLVDRFVGQTKTNGNVHRANGERSNSDGMGSVGSAANGKAESDSSNLDLEQLMKTWWLIAGQFLVGSARMAVAPFTGSVSDSGPAALDLGNSRGEGSLELHAEPAGRATAEVWLHNRGADDLGEVVLRCSDLLAHDGGVVPSAAVRFEPAVVPMPSRSSRGVAVNIALTPQVRPGVYRGTVLAGGNPDLWLSMVLTVRMPGS